MVMCVRMLGLEEKTAVASLLLYISAFKFCSYTHAVFLFNAFLNSIFMSVKVCFWAGMEWPICEVSGHESHSASWSVCSPPSFYSHFSTLPLCCLVNFRGTAEFCKEQQHSNNKRCYLGCQSCWGALSVPDRHIHKSKDECSRGSALL